MLHYDLWGPYDTPTYNGHRYFLTIFYNKSRGSAYLMKSKTETPSLLQNFINLVENQFKAVVKVVRTDQGTEFFNSDIQTIITSKGIIHEERKHKYILETARALRFQALLPGYCILSATYLIKRLPTPLLNNLTPHEILFKEAPNYSKLKVFGCFCYVSTSMVNRKKFDPRADVCVFPGYPFGFKGYKIYNIHTQKCVISRDVQFIEHCFPFSTLTGLRSLCLIKVNLITFYN
ncbi:LOW QUALITY PROTEIN: hypothetical protein V2J09_010767 [Rumex salicifolius]